jgi:hypothetical protein
VTLELLRAGKLSQTCPACHITEAAGSHCSACLRPMAEADWYVAERSAAQIEAGRRGRAARASCRKETATAEALTESELRSAWGDR